MKEIIVAENAPAAIGPYSHAVVINDMVFTSGQLGLIPETGKLPEGVEAQTEQALINLRNVLKASGTDMEHVVKTTVFVQDLADFAKVNAIYAKFFATNPPARSCVQVAKLPAGGLVEIEAVAVK
ncbi:MAG: RidA family protein [Clostridiales bacterium]|jgi:2-iminobutanoate/2-iminopropanoate deaminase|nr:RidA family protein [Clostridiales bacterium]